jgi:general secretion pathway protein K
VERRASPSPAVTLGEDGFALLLVALMVVLVTAFLLDRALRARTEYRQAANAAGDVRARAAAAAGVQHAISRLDAMIGRQPAARAGDGVATMMLADEGLRADLASVPLAPGVRYGVAVEDVASRLSVNDAGDDDLRRLFLALGAGFREADVAAQSVLDWRDADELHRGQGAEWDDWYRHQPVPVHPRNAPFQSVAELRQVRGMERLFARAAPYLTVAASVRVNVNTAPEPVLRSLPGLDGESIALLLGRRAGGRPVRDVFELQSQLSVRSRTTLQAAMAEFSSRAAFDSNLLEVVSTGAVSGLPFTRTVRARVARSGMEVQVVRIFEE